LGVPLPKSTKVNAMNYADARSQLKSGDVVALSHKEWTSWYDIQIQAVRFFTQSEYSHVGIVWMFAGRAFLIESVEPVVRIYPISHLVDKGFYLIPTDVPMSDAELEFLMSKVGISKYSKWEAILAYFGELNLGKDDFFECAELVIVARAHSGADLGSIATPSGVVQHLLETGHNLTFVKD
jgi:hypothetical protein